MTAQPFLDVRGLTKVYGGVRALADASLTVGRGEIIALAGENGSGKSTLASMIAGSLAPDAGEILIDGQPVVLARPRDALDRGIALVTQEITSIPEMSIAENVFLSRNTRLASVFRRGRLERQVRPMLQRAGISADPARAFSSLRMGDRERVEIARAIATNPRLIILDEATSRLGEADVDRLFSLLRDLRDEGVSSIIITHRLREIRELADRAIVLRDGRIVGELARAELTEQRLAQMMVGRELSDLYSERNSAPGSSPALEVRDLVVEGTVEPISFTVYPGQVVGLAGLVGSGRTELLETLAGRRGYSRGSVLIDGRPVAPGSVRRAMDAGIVLVPEDRHKQGLVMGASVQNNIAMASWRIWRGARASRDRRAAHDGVAHLQIKVPSVDAAVDALSGGNQQRVVMARSLGESPKVLLLDEPARGIDISAKADMFALINEVVEQGMAVVMASSDMLETLGMSDDIIVLHEGRIVGAIPRADATEARVALLAGGGSESS